MDSKSFGFDPLENITRPYLSTKEAAHYLNLKAHTLLVWSCKKRGPIQPVKIGGQLGWPTELVKFIVGVPK